MLYIDYDLFLNSQQRLVDYPLDKDDHFLIDMLMKHVSEIKEKKRRENLLISNQIYNDRFDNWRRPLNLNPNVIFDNNLMIDWSITISDGCYPKFNAELVSSQRQPCGMYEERSKAQWKLNEKDFKDIADGYDSKNEIYESKSEDSFDSEHRYASRKSQNSKKSSSEKQNANTIKPLTDLLDRSSLVKTQQEDRAKSITGLSLRADVMNKNLFRALRREWKEMFEAFVNSNNLVMSKKSKIFTPNLENFAGHLLSETNVRWEQLTDFNTKDFETYLGILANYWAMKKIVRNGREKDKLDKVYSVLYSYSHVKFNEFMGIPEIKALIMIICEKRGKESLIERNDTLSANKEKYEAHINKLLGSFN